MSQLSKNKKENILFALFLILIISLSIFLTYYLIHTHNKNILNPEKEQEEIQEEIEHSFLTFDKVSQKDGIDIYKKYPRNPITIDYTDKVTISGLKDKEVETKINEKLSELDATPPNQYVDACDINFNVSNVLSITCNYKTKNIDLTTGNDIKIEEIFNKDTDINSILIDALYKSACNSNYCYKEDEYINDEYPNLVENAITDYLKKIKNNTFTFDIYYTNIVLNDYMPGGFSESAWLEYSDILNEITIFERFLTNENIYEEKPKETCNAENCDSYFNKVDEDSYNYSNFINEHNYLEFSLYNDTASDLSYELEYPKQNLDLEKIANILKNKLIETYNLKETKNYRNINIDVDINSNSDNYNLINYTIEIKEYTKDNFEKSVMFSELVKSIKESSITKINMLISKDNQIAYLEENPSKIYSDFEEKLYNYIVKESEKENNPFSTYFGYCEFSDEEYDVCTKKYEEYHKLIKKASYAVDHENKELKMYYLIPGIGMAESYVNTRIPLSVFETTPEESETIIPSE